jgi:hypothetical protein
MAVRKCSKREKRRKIKNKNHTGTALRLEEERSEEYFNTLKAMEGCDEDKETELQCGYLSRVGRSGHHLCRRRDLNAQH